MSEAGEAEVTLPPAAFDISAYRSAVERAAHRSAAVPVLLALFVVGVIALVTLLVISGTTGSADFATLIAFGVAGVGVLLALLVVLPGEVAARSRRALRREATVFGMAAASGLTEHLASIGYAAPTVVTREWVDDPDSEATIPLVHDSVIAARWWRPTAADHRIFVEPYLRSGDTLSSLPALPPLSR